MSPPPFPRTLGGLLLVAPVALAALSALFVGGRRSGFRGLLLDGGHVARGGDSFCRRGGSFDPDGGRGSGSGFLFLGDCSLGDLRRSHGRVLGRTQRNL